MLEGCGTWVVFVRVVVVGGGEGGEVEECCVVLILSRSLRFRTSQWFQTLARSHFLLLQSFSPSSSYFNQKETTVWTIG